MFVCLLVFLPPGSIFCWCCVVVSCFAMTKEILFISSECRVGVGKMKVSRLLVKRLVIIFESSFCFWSTVVEAFLD